MLASKIDGKAQTTTYSYDQDCELITITYPTTFANNFDRQSAGALTTGGDPDLFTSTAGGSHLAVTYTYNPDDQVASVADPQNATTNLAYDIDSHLTQIAGPNAITQTLSYNSAGQVTKIAATNSGGTTLTSSSYSYTNPSNLPTLLRYSVTDASNNTTSYTYDALNRLTQAVQHNGSGGQIAGYAYCYYPSGQRDLADHQRGHHGAERQRRPSRARCQKRHHCSAPTGRAGDREGQAGRGRPWPDRPGLRRPYARPSIGGTLDL